MAVADSPDVPAVFAWMKKRPPLIVFPRMPGTGTAEDAQPVPAVAVADSVPAADSLSAPAVAVQDAQPVPAADSLQPWPFPLLLRMPRRARRG